VESKKEKGRVFLGSNSIIDPDAVVTPAEAKLLRKAQGQMRRGEYVALEQLENDLDRLDVYGATRRADG
jgi:hypothetical protein